MYSASEQSSVLQSASGTAMILMPFVLNIIIDCLTRTAHKSINPKQMTISHTDSLQTELGDNTSKRLRLPLVIGRRRACMQLECDAETCLRKSFAAEMLW